MTDQLKEERERWREKEDSDSCTVVSDGQHVLTRSVLFDEMLNTRRLYRQKVEHATCIKR